MFLGNKPAELEKRPRESFRSYRPCLGGFRRDRLSMDHSSLFSMDQTNLRAGIARHISMKFFR